MCGLSLPPKSRNLHVHHAVGYRDCSALREWLPNGITLCDTCHRWLHSEEGRASLLFLRADTIADYLVMSMRRLSETGPKGERGKLHVAAARAGQGVLEL